MKPAQLARCILDNIYKNRNGRFLLRKREGCGASSGAGLFSERRSLKLVQEVLCTASEQTSVQLGLCLCGGSARTVQGGAALDGTACMF